MGILHIGPEHLGRSMPLARLLLDERHLICRVYFLSESPNSLPLNCLSPEQLYDKEV